MRRGVGTGDWASRHLKSRGNLLVGGLPGLLEANVVKLGARIQQG